MRTFLKAALVSAALAVSIPTASFAVERDNVQAQIAAAKAKIDLNEKNGITGAAADIQARARAALDEATRQFNNSNENRAQAAAIEASALADQASATQQKQSIQDQTASLEPR